MVRKGFVMMLTFVMVTVSVSGCTSLRKKFIRQSKNKDQKEDFIPVLEPVEYKRVEESPIEAYRSHYGMIKAYFGDLDACVGQGGNDKRARYLAAQITAHLQGLSGLLGQEKKAVAEKLLARLQDAVKEYDKPSGIRRVDLLKGAFHSIESDIRKTLKPDAVKDQVVRQ